MTEQERDEIVLDRLVEESRAEKAPDLNWDGLEAALMKRVGETPRRRSRSRAPMLLAAAAVLLAIGGFFSVRGVVTDRATGAVREASKTELAPVDHPVNGDALAPGAVVTSGADELVVVHRGHVTWKLAPESAAHVEAVGDVVAIALDRGIVSAEVVKSPRPESFVVRVERTRVAVHGTRFRVARLSDSVRVDVQEGVVGVGPMGAAGFDLRAPDGATVTFNGVRTDVAASAVTGKREAEPSAGAPAATNASKPKAFGVPPVEADGLPRGALAGIEQVMTSVERCVRDNTVSGDDLRVTVETRLTLRVAATGSVGEASFAPPLAPSVAACVDAALETVRFPRSTDGFVIDRVLELSR